MLSNGFLTACGIVRVDFGWIRKGPKLADFEQNCPWFWRPDFGKCRESFQTSRNASYMLQNGFLTTCGIVDQDFGSIRKGPKSAYSEQKACATAYGFEGADFDKCRKSFQTP